MLQTVIHIADWMSRPLPMAELTDRWKGLRNWGTSSQDANWIWIVLGLGVCVLLAAAVVGGVFSRKPARRRTGSNFDTEALNLGLSQHEQAVLAHIAQGARLKDAQAVFTMEDVVIQGARDLLAGKGDGSPSLPDAEHLEAAIASLCRKLGFGSPVPTQSVFGTRHVPQGARMLIVDEDGTVQLAATVAGSDAENLILMADTELHLSPPVQILLRHGAQGMAREFDCQLVSCQGLQFRVRHAQAVRTMNLRRYVRVPMDEEALVAEWAFFQEGRDMRTPFFMQARMQEIAGPGLLIRMPTRNNLPEKLLVVVRLADRTVVQGVAAVRRVTRLEGGKSTVAIEFTELNPQELAELVRQTNLATHPQRPEETRAAAPRPMRQPAAAPAEELK